MEEQRDPAAERRDPCAARQRVKDICQSSYYDAIVVGSGPNGLACAIAMVQSGNKVLLVEGQSTAGGGLRTAELTVPGFKHDICSSVHPLGIGSPFFRTLKLEEHGLRWINPDSAYVHAFEPGNALVVARDLDETAENLGPGGDSFKLLMSGLLPDWDELSHVLLNPPELLLHPVALTRFGIRALLSARQLARVCLSGLQSRAAFAGVAAHSSLRLDAPGSASIGLSLALAAHGVGWPIPSGGAQSLTNSLLSVFESRGGELILGCPVRALTDLPTCRFVFFDVTPRQFAEIADPHLPHGYKKKMLSYRYGPGCFKMDWALSGPIPWSAPGFFKSPTVHLGGTFEDIEASERLVWQGLQSSFPYVLLTQPSLFDPLRAPEGGHVAWAYCHVPFNSTRDASSFIELQIERFAPGFRKIIIAKSVLGPRGLQDINENHIGGDINGGTLALSQLLTRPIPQLIPYSTPLPNVYLCSSSTPPGSGVHGMCGYYAAAAAIGFGDRKGMAVSGSIARAPQWSGRY